MPGRVAALIAGLLALALFPVERAQAQDFRVYTRIYNAALAKNDPRARQPVGRSTSLFHAGKVYDYPDSGSEMTIFEPAHGRFVLLDVSRQIAAELPFADVETLVYRAGKSAERKIAQLRSEGGRAGVQLAGHLEFQLEPKFTEAWDENAKRLTLAGGPLSYDVRCAAAESPELVEIYLAYADWAARLNYVVHPQAPLPAPRLAVDAALRRRAMLPIEVSLKTSGLHLRAEHRYEWKLDRLDLQAIAETEKSLANPELKRLPLKTYRSVRAETQTSARR